MCLCANLYMWDCGSVCLCVCVSFVCVSVCLCVCMYLFLLKQVLTRFILPLGEVVIDFYDRLKSVTKGYASLEYANYGYQDANVVKLTFVLNGNPVDALTTIVHKSNTEKVGRAIAVRLKEVLTRQQFDVAVQACVGAKVVARESIKAVRKNVLVKSGKTVGGGDISRKKKLLEKQKEGKKRMKRVGNVDLSQEAFLSVISAGR